MSDLTTIPAYVLRNAHDAAMAKAPAIREKEYGIWRTYNWRDYHGHVRDVALGLASLGFTRDDKLSVLGNNRPGLYWAQLAAMSLGGQSVPVYQDSIATELAYVLQHAGVKVIVAEDQEQVDKILSIRDQLPDLEWLVYIFPRGMTGYTEEFILDYRDVEKLGREFAAKNPDYFEAEIGKCAPDDIALIAYTSGTTGTPKGVMLSHDNLLATTYILLEHVEVDSNDDFLSYLPMAWVGDGLYGLCVSIVVGCATNCPESPDSLNRDLRELGPTGLIAAPRAWETMLSLLQLKAADASPVKRGVYEFFRGVAERAELAKAEGRPVPAGLAFWRAIGEFVVYGPVRDQLGLRRARWCLTGGAPLGPDTFRFFRGFGINLKQVYGSTEMSGLASLQPDDQANPDTVGPPCAGIEVRLDSDRGEVLVRSKGIFSGYYKQEDKTREALDDDGWLHTGDAGMLDDRGHLVIIDRQKDVGKLADGTLFAPQFIEMKLKFSPFISEAVAFGDDLPFVSSMIAIDFEAVGKFAERRNLPYTNYTDLAQKPEVRELIGEEIRKINFGLPDPLRVKRFLLLTKDLDADDNEVTRTRKLRRSFIAEKYAPVVAAFYGGDGEVDLKLDVTFEDGSRSQIDSHMVIEEAA